MQNLPLIFQLNGSLVDGRYLPGQVVLPQALRLATALIFCPAAIAAGTLTLTLEVAGIATSAQVELSPDTVYPVTLPLDLPIASNQSIRWRASFTGDPLTAPEQLMAFIYWGPDEGVLPPVLGLRWVNGNELFRLFELDLAAGTWSDISGGLSSGRVSVDTTNGLSISIGLQEALRVRSSVVSAPAFFENRQPPPEDPRLEWLVNSVVVAQLTAAGLWVGGPIRTAALPAPTANQIAYWNQFFLRDATQPVAVLGADGLTVLGLQEGLS